MNEAELGQLEAELLKIYMPGISKAHRRAQRKLCKEKGFKISSPELRQHLTNLLASIIRHRETPYEEMVAAVGKERARFFVQHQVSSGTGKRSADRVPRLVKPA